MIGLLLFAAAAFFPLIRLFFASLPNKKKKKSG
jgi:hypothetical protein